MSISDVLTPIDFASILKDRNSKNELYKPEQTMETKIQKLHENMNTKSLDLNENIVFLDYDDTLVPTAYLLSNIEYEINEETNLIKTFALKGKCNEIERQQFIANLEKAGNATFTLLKKIFSKFKPSNVKIVTNAVSGWLPESLFVAGSFCKIYSKIADLIEFHNTDIIYARNNDINRMHWKTKCFDQILWNYFNAMNIKNINGLNLLTIGDQWCDHNSIKQSFTYSVYNKRINHNQIKLYSSPDCRYLTIELNYVSNLLNEEILFEFNAKNEKGLLLEFDGYYENENDNN